MIMQLLSVSEIIFHVSKMSSFFQLPTLLAHLSNHAGNVGQLLCRQKGGVGPVFKSLFLKFQQNRLKAGESLFPFLFGALNNGEQEATYDAIDTYNKMECTLGGIVQDNPFRRQ